MELISLKDAAEQHANIDGWLYNCKRCTCHTGCFPRRIEIELLVRLIIRLHKNDFKSSEKRSGKLKTAQNLQKPMKK